MKSLLLPLILLFIFSSAHSRQENLSKKEINQKIRPLRYGQLPDRYKQFYDLIAYIASPLEKKAFLSLRNDIDRNEFSKLFWEQRDPSKGTPFNEFKEEHIRRYQYANRYLKKGSSRPGWKTDMGRIFIIMGPPFSRQPINSSDLYPVEIWEYITGGKNGMPPVVRLLFYRKNNMEYHLYTPGWDMPNKLISSQSQESPPAGKLPINPDTGNPYVYDTLLEIDKDLADASMSMIPGERGIGGRPSTQGSLITMSIIESPHKQIDIRYATDFIEKRGLVTVQESTNFIPSRQVSHIHFNSELNMHILHLAIQPEYISTDYLPDQDRHYLNYSLSINLRKDGKIVYQTQNTYPFYFSKDELENIQLNGLIIAEQIPIIPGECTLSALFINSVNNEFSSFELPLHISAIDSDSPVISGLTLTKEVYTSHPDTASPFQFTPHRAHIACEPVFTLEEVPHLIFSVQGSSRPPHLTAEVEITSLEKGSPSQGPIFLKLDLSLQTAAYTLPVPKLSTGQYDLSVHLVGPDQKRIHRRRTRFSITDAQTILRPTAIFKNLSGVNRFALHTILAGQYMETGQDEYAEIYFQKAIEHSPDNPGLIKAYSGFLLKGKDGRKVLDIITPLKESPDNTFDFHRLSGMAWLAIKKPKEAIESLIQANALYDSDITVLNSLGAAYLQTDELQKAKQVFTASLTIHQDQEALIRLIAEIDSRLSRSGSE